jgi:tol-pal system protein YbgF
MIQIKTPRNFARCFVLTSVLLIWQGSAFAIDRLPDRRSARAASSKVAANQSSSSSETLLELLGQVDSLQNELQELRNQSEVQAHEIERLKAQQKNVLQDLDQRLEHLERGSKGKTGFGQTTPGSSQDSGSGIGKNANKPGARSAFNAKNQSSQKVKKEYDAAFALLKQGAYEKASLSFRSFVKRNPESKLTGNAQYWIGEANYVMRNFKTALTEFKKVPKKYPNSSKVADAELKMGYVYFELEDWAKARKSLNGVIKKYPNTRVAKYAQNRLAKFKKNKKSKKKK